MSVFDKFDSYIARNSFILTGLTSYLRLYVISRVLKQGKKVLFVTSSEANAQKYQTDINKIFGIDSALFPYQSVSPYEQLYPDFYDYSEQVQCLLNPSNLVIAPTRALMEYFPSREFYNSKKLCYKVGDNISPNSFLVSSPFTNKVA